MVWHGSATWGVSVLVDAADTVDGNISTTLMTDPAQDPQFLQRVNAFLGRQRVASTLFGTVPDPRTLVEQLLRQCDEEALAQSFPQANCDTMPVFAPGIDVAPAAAHDFTAIAGQPATPGQIPGPRPAVLNYTSSPNASSGWYIDRGDPATNPCYGGQQPAPVGYGPDNQCDEYPFLSTAEAGPALTPPPLLLPIPTLANRTEGLQLQAFYRECPSVKTGTPFVVVPMTADPSGAVGAPSTAWCGLGGTP